MGDKPDEPDDDAALVARIRAGDQHAEQVLFSRHYPSVHESAMYRYNNAGLASDFCQEAFRVVLEKLRDGAGPADASTVAGYIYGIVKNLWVDDIRKANRRKTNADADKVGRFPDPNPGPADQIDREQSAAAVRKMLTRIRNPGYRELLLRFYILREDKPAICNRLGLSPSQFDIRIHRAREKFAEIVKKQREDDPS